jgi:hypothetical protein
MLMFGRSKKFLKIPIFRHYIVQTCLAMPCCILYIGVDKKGDRIVRNQSPVCASSAQCSFWKIL